MIYITTYPLTQRINPVRKLLLTTAAVAAAIGLTGCSKTPTPESVPETPNTLTDRRDGQTYRTVKIGNQTWMAENLNYKTKRGSRFYDRLMCDSDDSSYYARYGRVYDWKTAKKACPAGWKLPDTADWNMLVKIAGGKKAAKKLKSKNGWNHWEEGDSGKGTDDYGFSAQPGGGCVPNGYFELMCDFGRWWTATKYTGRAPPWYESAYFLAMYGADDDIRDRYSSDDIIEESDHISYGYSVRCIQESPTERRDNVRKFVRTTAVTAAARRLAIYKKVLSPESITYGTLADERDGKKYRTVEIGGKRWMAENLNYKTDGSWYYNNNFLNYHNYGRLYTWEAAMKACPAGYHLPSAEEWDGLEEAVGGNRKPDDNTDGRYGAVRRLKAKRGWVWDDYYDVSSNGTDDYGFSALPGGWCCGEHCECHRVGNIGLWWTATEKLCNGCDEAYYRRMSYNDDKAEEFESVNPKEYGYSVRCVADSGGIVLIAAAAAVGASSAAESAGTLTDSRDGQTYRTVRIGGQTWMAQNLNYRAGCSWCYGSGKDSCKKYGRLYTWDAAKTACPVEYHLPSREEWNALVDYAGGSRFAGWKLKAKRGWNWNKDDGVSGNGLDIYRFSALPGGYRNCDGRFCWDAGKGGDWWTTTGGDSGSAYSRGMLNNNDYVSEDSFDIDLGLSVRCVADRP